MRSNHLFFVLVITVVFVMGCSDDDNGDNGDNQGLEDAGGVTEDVDSDPPENGHCPTAVLPSETSVTYQGSTIGNDNLFESNRLEWDDAGDDALLYVVPETGTYEFAFDETMSDTQGCGVSMHERIDDSDVLFTPDLCPEQGEVRDLPDAFYTAGVGAPGTADLEADHELLILVSCAEWSTPQKETDYTLTIELQ